MICINCQDLIQSKVLPTEPFSKVEYIEERKNDNVDTNMKHVTMKPIIYEEWRIHPNKCIKSIHKKQLHRNKILCQHLNLI